MQEVRGEASATKTLEHEAIGRFELDYRTSRVSAATDRSLVVYHAAAGSRGAQALQLLAPLAAMAQFEGRDRSSSA